jgi:hypothetical protein
MTFFNLDERTEQGNAAFMQRVAALPLPGVSRDPMQIWWKAQLLRRWDAERRVTAPLDFMQPVEVAAGLACVAFLIYQAAPYFF